MRKSYPPKYPLRFFRWYCHPEYVEDLEGDLMERYERTIEQSLPRKANWNLTKDIIKLFRPGIIRPLGITRIINNNAMISNYLKVGWRNLIKNKGYSALNIGGLALGVTVAILVGLWIVDELSFDKHYKNYARMAAVLQHGTICVAKSGNR
ncbi:MAG: permease prefix domain 2-containing transporter [Bacteroidota bacterium]